MTSELFIYKKFAYKLHTHASLSLSLDIYIYIYIYIYIKKIEKQSNPKVMNLLKRKNPRFNKPSSGH